MEARSKSGSVHSFVFAEIFFLLNWFELQEEILGKGLFFLHPVSRWWHVRVGKMLLDGFRHRSSRRIYSLVKRPCQMWKGMFRANKKSVEK